MTSKDDLSRVRRIGAMRVRYFVRLMTAFVFCSLDCFAAPEITVLGATQTQVVVAIRGATGPCKVALSEDPVQANVVPDVDESKYGGAGSDRGRPDTVTTQDGTRIVTLGHMVGDRALAASTEYYLQISGCGGTVKASLTTANITLGTTQTWPVPFDPTKWGNRGWPVGPDSVTTKSRYIDPLTGLVLMPASNGMDWTMRYPGGGGQKSVRPGTLNFAYWAGGFGWINPGTVMAG